MPEIALDGLRYWFAVFVVIGMPPAMAYWFAVHPFVSRWRRLGPQRSHRILFSVFFLIVVGLFFVRDHLLVEDLGRPGYVRVAIGLALVVSAMYLQLSVSRHLSRYILTGGPELDPDNRGELLTSGPYAYCRNPRYVVIFVGLIAYGLLLNYVGVWICAALVGPALYFIVLLEERELKERFGEPYLEYLRTVPRFIPRRPRG